MPPEPAEGAYGLAAHIKSDLLNDARLEHSFVSAIDDNTSSRVAHFLFCDLNDDYMVTVTRLGTMPPNSVRRH